MRKDTRILDIIGIVLSVFALCFSASVKKKGDTKEPYSVLTLFFTELALFVLSITNYKLTKKELELR